MNIILTVADHEQNGFVALAQWSGLSEEEGNHIIAAVNAAIPDEAEPDAATEPYTFILDLMDGAHTRIDESRLLPMQLAMRVAREQVTYWLEDRPVPDLVSNKVPPTLSITNLLSFH